MVASKHCLSLLPYHSHPCREHPSCWSRVKAPAAVSLACLAATLLIAAQGFRGHPTTKHSNLPAQHSNENLRHEETMGQSSDVSSAMAQSTYKQPQKESQDPTQTAADSRISLSSTTSSSGSGVHRQKSFDFVEIATADDAFPADHSNATALAGNITAYREEVQGMEILVVNKTMNGRPPNGILLVFHGCAHGALDWWYPSPTCANCTGLPEEMAITKAVLRRDFVLVAFSSRDRELHECWDVSYGSDLDSSVDLAMVLSVWQELADRENWAKIPRYALGGSSGGVFALHLAMRLPLSGLVSIIMAAQSSMLEAKPRSADLSKSWSFPPTMFIHMPRDDSTAQNVAQNMAALKKQGVRVTQMLAEPLNISATFFSDRIEDISPSTSAEMHAALLVEGCLNSTGYLVDNPRSTAMMRRWQKALRENVAGWRSAAFKMDESPVFEELNVAWAGHELVSDHTEAMLDWLLTSTDGPKLMTAVNPRLS